MLLTADNLKLAQFLYLLLDNSELRDVIDTVTSRVVLILSRFTPERQEIIGLLRSELRRRGYLPVVFDWPAPAHRGFIETVSTVAHLARFVIADFTDSRVVNQEVPHIAGTVAIPIKPNNAERRAASK